MTLRVYISKKNKLTIAPNVYTKWGSTATDNIQIKDCGLVENIVRDIDDAISVIINRYENQIENLNLLPFFEEKQRQIKQSYDYETALTELIEGAEIVEKEGVMMR
ncbi:hypothetical protein [Streptococcus pluranimalium]|uniref:hypothetical protein n=1 Tax=Streptococcus pluranimalium TaxID=82348 RepID=UPI003F664D8B